MARLRLPQLLGIAILGFLALVTSTFALTEEAAFSFDAYLPRQGTPLVSRFPSLSLNPRYHRILSHVSGEVETGKAQTALFSVSDRGVIAARNPRNGALVWRQQISEEVQGFWLDGEMAIVISGQGGEKAQAFHALTGWPLWTKQLLPPGGGRQVNDDVGQPTQGPHSNKLAATQREVFPGVDAVFVPIPESASWEPVMLNNGDTVRKIEFDSGKELWRFSRRDNGEDR